jgi:hypothetical protein
MSTHASDPIERQLQEHALRPADAGFTRRVLGALPPRAPRMDTPVRRTFAVTTRVGVGLALLVGAERAWWLLGGGLDALIMILIVLFPAAAAAQSLCGALIPRRHWR